MNVVRLVAIVVIQQLFHLDHHLALHAIHPLPINIRINVKRRIRIPCNNTRPHLQQLQQSSVRERRVNKLVLHLRLHNVKTNISSTVFTITYACKLIDIDAVIKGDSLPIELREDREKMTNMPFAQAKHLLELRMQRENDAGGRQIVQHHVQILDLSMDRDGNVLGETAHHTSVDRHILCERMEPSQRNILHILEYLGPAAVAEHDDLELPLLLNVARHLDDVCLGSAHPLLQNIGTGPRLEPAIRHKCKQRLGLDDANIVRRIHLVQIHEHVVPRQLDLILVCFRFVLLQEETSALLSQNEITLLVTQL